MAGETNSSWVGQGICPIVLCVCTCIVFVCACVHLCVCMCVLFIFPLSMKFSFSFFPSSFPPPTSSPENQPLFESSFTPLPAPFRLVFIALQRQCHTFSYKEAEVTIDRSQTVELPCTLASDEAMTVWCALTCRS